MPDQPQADQREEEGGVADPHDYAIHRASPRSVKTARISLSCVLSRSSSLRTKLRPPSVLTSFGRSLNQASKRSLSAAPFPSIFRNCQNALPQTSVPSISTEFGSGRTSLKGRCVVRSQAVEAGLGFGSSTKLHGKYHARADSMAL